MRLIGYISIILLLAGCLVLPQRVTQTERIKIDAFEIWLTPESKNWGSWSNRARILMIEGEMYQDKFLVSDKVLLHEIQHILHDADKRFKHPHRGK